MSDKIERLEQLNNWILELQHTLNVDRLEWVFASFGVAEVTQTHMFYLAMQDISHILHKVTGITVHPGHPNGILIFQVADSFGAFLPSLTVTESRRISSILKKAVALMEEEDDENPM
jgi:hypothetical protein